MVVKRLKKFLTGQTGAIKDTTRRSGGGKYLQYPINRTQAESEDSLLIKALEYMPPKSGVSNDQRSGTFGLKSGFDIDKAISDGTFQPGSQISGTFNVTDVKWDKTGKITGSKKAFKIAKNYYQRGQLEKAKNICLEIIKEKPNHLESLRLLS